jgi:hypothetical protein
MQFSLLALIIDKMNNLQNVQNYKTENPGAWLLYNTFLISSCSHFDKRFEARN